MAPAQRGRAAAAALKNNQDHQADTASSSNSSGKSKQSKKVEEKKPFSFIFVLFMGFAVLLAYTVWSSIQTYSNTMVNDMD